MPQRVLLEVLGVEPPEPDETPRPRKHARADKWAIDLAAARQYYDREDHLRPPRKHVEAVIVDGEEHQVRVGVWVSNLRSRAGSLTPEQTDELSAIGMRWT